MHSNQKKPSNESQSASQLVEQILTSSFESESAQRLSESAKRKFWQSPTVAWSGLVVVMVMTVWNVMRFNAMPEGFTPEEASTYVQFVTTTNAIDHFSDSTGRLPSSLSQLHIDQSGLSYSVNGNGYTLSAVVDGQSVTHRSGVPLLPLKQGFEALDMKGSR